MRRDRKYFVGCSRQRAAGHDVRAALSRLLRRHRHLRARDERVERSAQLPAAWDTQTYLSVAPADSDGRRVLSGAFSDADLALVARRYQDGV